MLALMSSAYAVDIPFTLDKSGNVSLAIYDAKGRMIRTLLRAEPMTVGKHTVDWDGLDREGNPVTGDVQWRLATSQGLHSEYLLSVGTSMRENIWPAQHGPLCAVQTDGSRIFVTAGMSEGAPQTGCMNIDGKWRWVSGPTGGWMGGNDLALDGDTLYFLGGPMCNDARLFVQQAENGQGKPGIRNTENWGGYPNWHVEKFDHPRRVDARDGELVIASLSGLIVWLDPITGEERDRLSVEGGLTDFSLLGGGRILAISGNDIIEMARGKAERTVRIANLISPQRIAVDRVTGDIFIAEAGTSQQIKHFSPDWKLQQVFGRAGGRKTGVYKPEDFLDVSDLAGDGKGGYVITETSGPRRTTHFSAAGKVVNEWYGGQSFYSYVAPEPDNPDRLWMHSDGWITQLAVDYEHRTWKPLATYRFGDGIDRDMITAGFGYCSGFQVKRLDLVGSGRMETYLMSKWNLPLLLKVDEAAGLLRPVATMGSVPGNFVVPVDTSRQVPIPDVDKPDSWTLSAAVKWAIYNQGQHGWLEVLDIDGKPIVSCYMFRGNPKPNITSNAGHTNYLVFNDGELLNGNSPNWKLTNSLQEIKITVSNGIATLTYGGIVKLERPILKGDWKKPARLCLRTTNGASISAIKAVFSQNASDKLSESIVDIEGAPDIKAPVKPAAWAEAIRLLGKNPEDSSVRSQLANFAWADTNDDYVIQAGELKLSNAGGTGSTLFIEDNLNIYLRSDAAGGPDYRVVEVLGRTPTGNPIWDWSRQRSGPNTPFSQTRSLWADTKGNVYQTSAYNGDGYNHNWQWPATFVNATAVVKTGPDGTMLWQAGERAARGLPHPRGQMHYPINTLGVVHGCVGFADYIENPAEFWTEDGLYIGGVFDSHADGPHPRAYSWFRVNINKGDDFTDNLALLQYDMLVGGNLATRRNGDVLFFGCGWNNMPVYHITGWDQIKRQQGTVAVPTTPRTATRKGTGLQAEYFPNDKLEGEAVLKRVDASIWFDSKNAWLSDDNKEPTNPDEQKDLDDSRTWVQKKWSARWTGTIEPVVSGYHTFSVYTTDAGIRLWLGGRLLIDNWEAGGKFWSYPVDLHAGHRYPIRMELRRIGDKPEVHLNWEALDLPVAHIPKTAMYSDTQSTVLNISSLSTVILKDSGDKVQFRIERTGPADAPLVIPFKLVGTAKPGIDYIPAQQQSIVIEAGKREAKLIIKIIDNPALSSGATIRFVPEVSEDYIINESVMPEVAIRMPKDSGYRCYDRIVAAQKYVDTLNLDIGQPIAEWVLSCRGNFNVMHANDEALFEVLDADGKSIISLYMFRGDAKPNITKNAGHTNYLVFNNHELLNAASPDWKYANGLQDIVITVANGMATIKYGDTVKLECPVLQGDYTRPALVRARSNTTTAAVRVIIGNLKYRIPIDVK